MALAGCVSLRPLEDVAAEIRGGRHLLVDGLRVHVEESGQGEPVVLVHGFGGSTYSWRKIVPELSARYRVIAIDLIGFGLSERPEDPTLYDRPAQVELLSRVLDALALESAHWVGHSYGGGLVTTLAYRYPERVRSLTLIATTASNYAEARRGRSGRRPFASVYVRGLALRPRFVRRALERSFADDSLVDTELVEAYLDRLRIAGAVDAWVGLTAPRPSPGPDWQVEPGKLELPILVLWGEDDELIGIETARTGVAALPSARFVSIRECGHIPMEEAPGAVLRELQRFLDDLPASQVSHLSPADNG